MKLIILDGCVYRVHPVYDSYAADDDGYVINIVKQIPHKGDKGHNGYLRCNVRKHAQNGQKKSYVHRFVWECFNGIIPEGKVIDHINNDKEDNRLCNLQLMTRRQNCKKSAKDRDYTFVKDNHRNKKCVKATNCETKEVTYYNSMCATQQHLGINVGIIKMACEGLNHCKSGISKKDGHRYKFEYVNPDDMPANHKKSANIRPRRLSDEERKKNDVERTKIWRKKEYQCPRCDKTMMKGSKYAHNKICK